MKFEAPRKRGVLPSQWLRKARDQGYIYSATYTMEDRQIQPASFDLRLGEKAVRLRCSFLPGHASVEDKLPGFKMGEVDLRDGGILERNRPYLIPLSESLDLPPGLLGRANPKSSTGRLDIFTRLITDRSHFFDEIAPGYKGQLYLEVVSRSFTVRLQRGLSLNQLRLSVPDTPLDDEALRSFHEERPLLYFADRAFSAEDLPLSEGLFLSLALPGGQDRMSVGWRAKKNSKLLDLTAVGSHDPLDYWEPVYPERYGGIILEPEEFYLLLSRESVRVPPSLAAEMAAYDPTSGELRTHYAGFFDPGFGHGDATSSGSRAALEVRAHDVPFMVDDGQRICRLSFEQLCETPDFSYGSSSSHYQFQTSTLSKHFRMPPPEQPKEQRQVSERSEPDMVGVPLFELPDS